MTTRVVYLDIHDEQDWWMVTALRGIGHPSTAAQQHITNEITRIAAERRMDLHKLTNQYAKEFDT